MQASHDNGDLVRSAIITQKHRLLTVVFFNDHDIPPSDQHRHAAQIEVSGWAGMFSLNTF
jgi:hypothetical protein